MKSVFTLSILALGLAAPAFARAEYSIHCGEGREKGAGFAEVSLVEGEVESGFYLRGKALGHDEFGVAAREGKYLVTVFGDGKAPDRKFEFLLKRKKVQEYILSDDGQEAAGKAKNCVVSDEA